MEMTWRWRLFFSFSTGDFLRNFNGNGCQNCQCYADLCSTSVLKILTSFLWSIRVQTMENCCRLVNSKTNIFINTNLFYRFRRTKDNFSASSDRKMVSAQDFFPFTLSQHRMYQGLCCHMKFYRGKNENLNLLRKWVGARLRDPPCWSNFI